MKASATGRNRDIPFAVFWDAYGLKKDRKAAEGAWKRLSARDRRAAVEGIAAYREECRRTGVSMMYGPGYLNHRRWEDETDTPAAAPEPAAGAAVPEEMELW